jgi:hypothetical protein
MFCLIIYATDIKLTEPLWTSQAGWLMQEAAMTGDSHPLAIHVTVEQAHAR